jgi:hypothetical protein
LKKTLNIQAVKDFDVFNVRKLILTQLNVWNGPYQNTPYMSSKSDIINVKLIQTCMLGAFLLVVVFLENTLSPTVRAGQLELMRQQSEISKRNVKTKRLPSNKRRHFWNSYSCGFIHQIIF